MKKQNFNHLAVSCLALGLIAAAPVTATENTFEESVLLAGGSCGGGHCSANRMNSTPSQPTNTDETVNPEDPYRPRNVGPQNNNGGSCNHVAQNSGKSIELSRRVNLI